MQHNTRHESEIILGMCFFTVSRTVTRISESYFLEKTELDKTLADMERITRHKGLTSAKSDLVFSVFEITANNIR